MYLGDGEQGKVAEILISAVRGHRLANGSIPLLVRVFIEDDDVGGMQGPIEFMLVKDEHGPYYESVSPLEIGGVPQSKIRVRLGVSK
ncbi:MAG: hypothetical protein ACRD1Z_20255 [Vicinamibacteria bacterium]